MARITPCLENGKTVQVPETIERCGGSTEFIVLRDKENLSADYMYWVATAPSVRHRAIGLMHGTSGRQRVSAQDFAGIRIPFPPENERQKAVGLLNHIETQSKALLARIESGKALKKQMMMTLLTE